MSHQTRNNENQPYLLLIEDNPIIQRSTCLLLDDLGCRIDVAGTGNDAIEYYAHKMYDLIILDLGLPDMNGFTVARHIRATANYQTIPIIILSAHDKERQMVGIEEGLVDDYFVKPLTYEHAEAIMAYLSRNS